MLALIDLRGRPVDPELLSPPGGIDAEVLVAVRDILDRVRGEGDTALLELTRRFDGPDLSGPGLAVTRHEIERAGASLPDPVRAAIDTLLERLRELHGRQVPREWREERDGVSFGEAIRPLSRVGCYVPGGRAAYPSTVAMTVVPAAVAGVPEIVVATPPRSDGTVHPAVLYAAQRAGATAVYRVGGAQAIAALAYGTDTIPRVDKVVGPGNVHVTAAKREVAGVVGIDGLAGPTDLVVVADGSADPELLGADLVAQAEHDPLARATLVTTDEGLPARVDENLDRELDTAARREIVSASLGHARAVVVEDEARAAEVVNAIAPEHLQVATAKPRAFLPLVRSAGAIFLGPWTPVPLGDYGVGSNHVLPTMGTARFASGLRATDFLTVSAVVEASPEAAARLAPEVAALARAEGLEGHARAVELRAERARKARRPS